MRTFPFVGVVAGSLALLVFGLAFYVSILYLR